MRVSDRDSFLTTRRLAELEGMLVGGSCGLAVHAALVVAAELDDPAAMVAVILPDGGRAYLSKIFNDTWMASHGMLERQSDRTVGDVLRAKRAAGEIPPLVVVETRQRVRDAIALLHEHRVSQLPVVSHTDPGAVVGSIGERGLLKHAADDPAIMGTPIVDVMEPPFPASPPPTRCARRWSCSPATARRCSSRRTAGRRASSPAPTCWRRSSRDGVRHPRRPRRPGT